jgi:ribosomal protein L16/L10AE
MTYKHRIPLGLLMLEQGWITSRQLREARQAQKAAGTGRIGDWLLELHAVDEMTITRALGLQWCCPVLASGPEDLALFPGVMPRLFLDAFGALPLRGETGKVMYLGFEHRLDPTLALAVQRITGLRVECGIVRSSVFHSAHRQLLDEPFPPVQLGEAISERSIGHTMARSVERAQPVAARLVRVHGCVWLRMFLSSDPKQNSRPEKTRDVVFSIDRMSMGQSSSDDGFCRLPQ